MTDLKVLLERLRWGQRHGCELPHAQAALYDAVVALTERAVREDEKKRLHTSVVIKATNQET